MQKDISRLFSNRAQKIRIELTLPTGADFFMITRISKTIFHSAVGDPLRRKALAYAIYIKDIRTSTVFRDFSYREMGKIAGVSPTTAKKYITTLRKMGLVSITRHRNGYNYLAFKKLRKRKIKNKGNDLYHTPLYSDIMIDKLDMSSVRSIEKGLMALFIDEHARKTDYIRHLIKLGTNPSKFDQSKEIKRARKICRKKGLKEYVEHGFSYRKIKKGLHCGNGSVRKTIILGESLGLFEAYRPELVHIAYPGYNRGKESLPFYQQEDSKHILFATKSNIYYQPPLVFFHLD